MHFYWFFSAKVYFKVCIEAQNNSVTIFFMLRWHRTVHVWLHHKNFNAYFSKSINNNLFKVVCIYKVLLYLSSPANQIVQLCVKWKLEILGV